MYFLGHPEGTRTDQAKNSQVGGFGKHSLLSFVCVCVCYMERQQSDERGDTGPASTVGHLKALRFVLTDTPAGLREDKGVLRDLPHPLPCGMDLRVKGAALAPAVTSSPVSLQGHPQGVGRGPSCSPCHSGCHGGLCAGPVLALLASRWVGLQLSLIPAAAPGGQPLVGRTLASRTTRFVLGMSRWASLRGCWPCCPWNPWHSRVPLCFLGMLAFCSRGLQAAFFHTTTDLPEAC